MGSIQPEDQIPTWDDPLIVMKDPSFRLKGLHADPACPNLLGTCTRNDITPRLGSELTGIQLKDLTDVQVEELNKFIAQRGPVVFRDQDWTEWDQERLGRRMGELQPDDRRIEGHPESLIVNRVDASSTDAQGEIFHSDKMFEQIPPAYIMLHCLVNAPDGGGDTLFANMYAMWDKLSPAMKDFLKDKQAIHKRAAWA